MPQSAHAKVSEQLCGISSLFLPLSRFWGLNLGCQPCSASHLDSPGLELPTLLPPPHKGWDCRTLSPCFEFSSRL